MSEGVTECEIEEMEEVVGELKDERDRLKERLTSVENQINAFEKQVWRLKARKLRADSEQDDDREIRTDGGTSLSGVVHTNSRNSASPHEQLLPAAIGFAVPSGQTLPAKMFPQCSQTRTVLSMLSPFLIPHCAVCEFIAIPPTNVGFSCNVQPDTEHENQDEPGCNKDE